ncbi:STAS domain-containing protein [Idiomarina seosinensis]|uniref:STAS domain-containing protein n=1 Tax=Idiomarina seosinensis TaxID=281739 RepID=UPI00384AB8AD
MTASINFNLDEQGELHLQGELTRVTVPTIWSRWQREVLSKKVKQVQVSDVSSFDTAGVALLLEIIKSQDEKCLNCVGDNEQLKQIAAVSGVESLLSLS